jgi:hypothetical protein
MLKTDSEDEDEVVSSSFDRNNGVEVTHAETFVHSGRIPWYRWSRRRREKNLKVAPSLKNEENRSAKLIWMV